MRIIGDFGFNLYTRGTSIGNFGGAVSTRTSSTSYTSYSFDLTSPSVLSGMTFSRNSIATYYDSSGLLKTLSANQIRNDYDPTTLSALGILMEPESINLLKQSQAIGTSPWISTTTITQNAIASPSGAIDASRVTLNTSTGSGYDFFQAINSGLNPGRTYIMSTYVLLGTATNFVIVVNNQNAWNTVGGQAYSAVDGLNTSTWKRITFTFVAPSNGMINVHIGQHGQTGVAAQTNGTAYMWGAQIEPDYLSSYIPTTSTSVRRLADTLKVNIDDGGYDIILADGNGSETRTGAGSYKGYNIEPRSGQSRIKSINFNGTDIGVYHPAAAEAIARAGITDSTAKLQLNDFVTECIALGIYDRMTFVSFDSRYNGVTLGGGGWATNSIGAGNRVNYSWTPTGASLSAGGTILQRTVGSKSTQYIRSKWTHDPSINPMFGSLFRATQNASSVNDSYYDAVGKAQTVIDRIDGVGILGFGNNQSGSVGSGMSPIWYGPKSPQGSDGYNECTVPEFGADKANSSPYAPSLLLIKRNVGSKTMRSIWNSIDAVQDGNANFVDLPFDYIDFVGPTFSGTSTGIQYGAFYFWGTKSEIEALALEKLFDVVNCTLLRHEVTNIKILGTGQSNSTIQTLYSLAHRTVGYGMTANRTIGANITTYGGNPIANWLVNPIINNGVGFEQADAQANSDNAFNSPIRGVRYDSSLIVMENNLPITPVTQAYTKIILLYNQGESDTDYLFLANRFQTQLRRLLDFYVADFNALGFSQVKIITPIIDYDPPARTSSPGAEFTLSGLTGTASGANGAYTITPASGETDYTVAYAWTKGLYTIVKSSGQWEIRLSGVAIATSTGPQTEHPAISTGWSFVAGGGGLPAFTETRYGENIERVRAAYPSLSASDSTMAIFSTRDFPRTNTNDNVHYYNIDTSLGLFATRAKAAIESKI